MTIIHARQIRLTKMHVMKARKVLYIVSNIFSHHIAHTFYPSPWLLTTLPPIYILPITPRFHPFPTLHFTTLPFTSLHFTSLHFSMIFLTLFFKLTSIIAFLTLFFKVFNLQGRISNTSAGSWFQSWMVLFTMEYFPIPVLCLLLLIFRSWSILLR